MPHFGPYLQERERLAARNRSNQAGGKCSPADEEVRSERRRALADRGVSSISDIVGIALPLIGAYNELDNVQQKVALIDPVSRLKYISILNFILPIEKA